MAKTIYATDQFEADYIRRNLYDEDDELFFDQDSQLSYRVMKGLPYVEIYLEDNFICVMEVWNDSSSEIDPEREYLTINHCIYYLDEMKQIV